MSKDNIYFKMPITFLRQISTTTYKAKAKHHLKNQLQQSLVDSLYYSFHQYVIENDYHDDLETAANELNVNFGNIRNAYENGNLLSNRTPDNIPRASISRTIFWDFHNSEKTEFQTVCFLAYVGLKSIIQTQAYKKITDEYLFARMGGNIKKGNPVSGFLKKYYNRYWKDKIKNELQLSWGLKMYSAKNIRGYYVSFKMPIDDLIKEVIAGENKKAIKLQSLKKQKEEIATEVKKQLFTHTVISRALQTL